MTLFSFRLLPTLFLVAFLAGLGSSYAFCQEPDSTLSAKPYAANVSDTSKKVLPIYSDSAANQEKKNDGSMSALNSGEITTDQSNKEDGWDWKLIWTACEVIVSFFALVFGLYKWKSSGKDLWRKLRLQKEFDQENEDQHLDKEYKIYRETLIEEHNKSTIPSSTVFQSFSVTLRDTFVSLSLSDATQSDVSDGHSEQFSNQQQRRIFFPQELLGLAFERGRRLLLIIGHPGAGKTTLMKHYLLSLLSAHQYDAFGFRSPVKVFFLFLRELKKDSDYRDLAKQLAEQDYAKCSADVFARWLNDDKSLILLDGLDEISEEPDRIRACEWIDSMVAKYPKACFVVSSRPTGYRKGDGIELKTVLVRADIQGFTEKQQDEFLDKWFKAYYCLKEMRDDEVDEDEWTRHQEEKAREKAGGIKAFLDDEKNITLRKLASSPLLLQIMAMLWKERDKLPGSRVELYESALYYLLGYRDEKRGLIPLIPANDAMKVLAPVALWMQEEIRKDEAEQENIIQKMGEELSVLSDPPDKELFFKRIVDRSGLLVRYVNTTQYQFSHKTFREYLAGFQLKEDRPYEHLGKLVKHFGEDWWSEVLRFFLWQVDANVFNAFMKKFFDSAKSESLTQKEQDLLALLVEEAPRKKIDALQKKLLDQTTGVNQQLYLLDCLDRIRLQNPAGSDVVGAVRDFINSENVQDNKVMLRAQEMMGADSVSGEEVFISHVELDAQYIRIEKGDFIFSVSGTAVSVEELYVAKYPVTNKRYRQFIAHFDSVKDYRQSLLEIARQSDDKRFFPYLQQQTNWAELFSSFYDDNERFAQDDQPVVGVSWYAARAYCLWLSMLESKGNEKGRYRLPTEMEWEWAAGGRRDKSGEVLEVREYPWGDKPEPTPKHANYDKNEGATTPVGRYPDGATPEGLYDMAGNVWEWMENWYDDNAKKSKALRGGSWFNYADNLCCSARNYYIPQYWNFNFGFRVVRPSPSS